MLRETIELSSKEQWLELRSRDVTSTEVAALFDLNPYMSKFELWQRKKNNLVVTIEENERMKWGSRLEHTIAQGISEDFNLPTTPFKSYMRIPELKVGSSFDYLINKGTDLEAILEIKNVDSMMFKDKWLMEDGEITEAPPHIELQVQHQLFVSGKKTAYIGALVGGNKVYLIKREYDEGLVNEIKSRVVKFWESIDKNLAPSPDFKSDYKFISSMLNRSQSGYEVENFSNELHMLVEQYKKVSEQEKEISETKDIIKAKILMIVGEAEKVKGDGFTISAGMVKGGPISYVRKDYRNMRINFKREK